MIILCLQHQVDFVQLDSTVLKARQLQHLQTTCVQQVTSVRKVLQIRLDAWMEPTSQMKDSLNVLHAYKVMVSMPWNNSHICLVKWS